MNHEIQNILSGKSQVVYGNFIQATANYLRRSQKTSTLAKTDKHFKSEETAHLRKWICENQYWVNGIDLKNYISEGAEQKVYLKNESTVLKLNDSIYYESWLDYLNNLLLNNYFFPDTAYNLLGFYENEKIIYAVVEQQFVKANQTTNLEKVCQFMQDNGFIKIRNNDYFNHEFGIILEDLHDENVLTRDGALYFIDTVFYIKY